ncbi:hypothetical protein WICPIJ_009341 [Wickerhamomyces pijperi]|uniref:Uncharacterized protein n=1 Tax=Wickerhamomyces pijperi TaxID=599730 RepID=A0A9P8TE91_WICPI|nr:hypothetical protein WICPIJ_009341 [Wickerhamomyces pijperi]
MAPRLRNHNTNSEGGTTSNTSGNGTSTQSSQSTRRRYGDLIPRGSQRVADGSDSTPARKTVVELKPDSTYRNLRSKPIYFSKEQTPPATPGTPGTPDSSDESSAIQKRLEVLDLNSLASSSDNLGFVSSATDSMRKRLRSSGYLNNNSRVTKKVKADNTSIYSNSTNSSAFAQLEISNRTWDSGSALSAWNGINSQNKRDENENETNIEDHEGESIKRIEEVKLPEFSTDESQHLDLIIDEAITERRISLRKRQAVNPKPSSKPTASFKFKVNIQPDMPVRTTKDTKPSSGLQSSKDGRSIAAPKPEDTQASDSTSRKNYRKHQRNRKREDLVKRTKANIKNLPSYSSAEDSTSADSLEVRLMNEETQTQQQRRKSQTQPAAQDHNKESSKKNSTLIQQPKFSQEFLQRHGYGFFPLAGIKPKFERLSFKGLTYVYESSSGWKLRITKMEDEVYYIDCYDHAGTKIPSMNLNRFSLDFTTNH